MLISDFLLEQSRTLAISVPADAIERFIALSGDAAPIHTDVEFARRAGFHAPIVHGAYLTAMVSRFVGMEFPGKDAVLERLDLSFRRPCYAPCELLVRGTIKQISAAVSTIVLNIEIAVSDGEIVATGKTWHRILGQ